MAQGLSLGAPQSPLVFFFTDDENSPSNITRGSLFAKNADNHFCKIPSIPYRLSLCNSFLCGSVSNALLKSSMIRSLWILE